MKKQHDDTQPAGTVQKKEGEELKAALEEYKTKYLRALADYQNLEKRIQSERAMIKDHAERVLIEKLLPVFDNFKRLRVHYADDPAVESVFKQLHEVLEGYGLGGITIEGAHFDPHTMECIAVEEAEDGKDNIVTEVFEPAYTFRGKLIRAAKVKVRKVQKKE